jgi:hypothetical protein
MSGQPSVPKNNWLKVRLSGIAELPVGGAATITGTVLGIHRSGVKKNEEPCVLLMRDANGLMYEAWLDYSTRAVSKCSNVAVADVLELQGTRCEPVQSHRAYGGLREPGFNEASKIEFFSVTDRVAP